MYRERLEQEMEKALDQWEVEDSLSLNRNGCLSDKLCMTRQRLLLEYPIGNTKIGSIPKILN